MEINKEEYLNVLEKIDSDLVLKTRLKEFIETYDGTNAIEFESLVLSAIGALTKAEEYRIKSEHYDQIDEIESQMYDRLGMMKNEFATLEKGELPGAPPVMAPGQEDSE